MGNHVCPYGSSTLYQLGDSPLFVAINNHNFPLTWEAETERSILKSVTSWSLICTPPLSVHSLTEWFLPSTNNNILNTHNYVDPLLISLVLVSMFKKESVYTLHCRVNTFISEEWTRFALWWRNTVSVTRQDKSHRSCSYTCPLQLCDVYIIEHSFCRPLVSMHWLWLLYHFWPHPTRSNPCFSLLCCKGSMLCLNVALGNYWAFSS